MKFLNEPKELNHNLLPGKVVSISVGENTCAAVTGTLHCYICTTVTGVLQSLVYCSQDGVVIDIG